MGRPKKSDGPQNGGAINPPDFERGLRIIKTDLNPLTEKSAAIRGDQSAAWKMIEKDCYLNKKGAKFFHAIKRMDPEIRDDVLRTLFGLMKTDGIGLRRDLVDQAEGADDDDDDFPIVDAVPPVLATLDTGAAAH